VIENARTGEQIEVVSETPEVLTMLATWTRPGHRATEHLHPGMEERWEVLEGRAAFRIDGVEVEGGPGTVVVAPRGRRHLAWNPTGAVVRLRIEMRPALRWAEFTTRLFRGDDPAALLAQYPEEVALPPREEPGTPG
jgi:mannose-6-phosphate isomerase-like protein (cupin superfamily)